MLFIAHLQQLDRAPGTLASYRYAVRWFHDIMGFPSCITPQVERALDACSLANIRPVVPKAPIDSACLASLVQAAMQRSTAPGDCWSRLATIIAVQQNSKARINEILSVKFGNLQFSLSNITIHLSFDNDKVASHRVRQSSRRKNNSVITIPNDTNNNLGYNLFLKWCHALKQYPHDPDQLVFPSPTSPGHISYSSIRIQLKSILTDIGLDATTFGTHSLRRGGAHDALAAGLPLPAIKVQLRHAPRSTSTFRYLPPGTPRPQRPSEV
jgi:integrase